MNSTSSWKEICSIMNTSQKLLTFINGHKSKTLKATDHHVNRAEQNKKTVNHATFSILLGYASGTIDWVFLSIKTSCGINEPNPADSPDLLNLFSFYVLHAFSIYQCHFPFDSEQYIYISGSRAKLSDVTLSFICIYPVTYNSPYCTVIGNLRGNFASPYKLDRRLWR